MINYLRHMAVFAEVVDEGSFRAAAKSLDLAPSRVSQTVADLEEYLGTTLLHRTTRKVALTDEGRRFYNHVSEITPNAELGLNELKAFSTEPKGSLKISLPAFLASSSLSTSIAAFANLHPGVTFSLSYSDQVIDMLNEGLDMSIRVGWLKDSSMMSRKLGESRRLLVASKAYMETRPVVQHPLELQDWDWVRFSVQPSTVEFTSQAGEQVRITERVRIGVSSAEAIRHFVGENLGLATLPEHMVQRGLSSGALVHVLPEWEVKPLGFYAVWPDSSRRENLTLHLVRFLVERGL